VRFYEALEILGLEDDSSLTPDHVRRTYMRKLRQYSPEKDPEGFRTCREAYELLRAYAQDLPMDRPVVEEDEDEDDEGTTDSTYSLECDEVPDARTNAARDSTYSLGRDEIYPDDEEDDDDDDDGEPYVGEDSSAGVGLAPEGMPLAALVEKILLLLEHEEITERSISPPRFLCGAGCRHGA
jgi:hypothetical protein